MIVNLTELRGQRSPPTAPELEATDSAGRDAMEEHPSALDGCTRTLHIRCGHDIMHKLAVAGFVGDFLWFADPYVQGPVPRAASLEHFVRIRASYLEEHHEARDAFDGLLASYRDLEKARDYEIVSIWMEHDSYDQLVLAKLLDFFSDPTKRPSASSRSANCRRKRYACCGTTSKT
jgi:hypothetical protein